MEETLGAAENSARRSSMDKAKAARMKRLYSDALMVLGVWVCLYIRGVLMGVGGTAAGQEGVGHPSFVFCFFQLCSGKFCFLCVTNPAANFGPWQWAVVAAATAMKGSSSKANSNGREAGMCVAFDY